MPTAVCRRMGASLYRAGGTDGQTRRDCDTAVSQSLPSPVSVLATSDLSRVEINGQRTPALDKSKVLVVSVKILIAVIGVRMEGCGILL